MKVKLHNGDLLIEPETEFEVDYLYHKIGGGKVFSAFIKTGAEVTDLLGVKLIAIEKDKIQIKNEKKVR